MSRLGQAVPKTLAILVAILFLLGAVVTAAPALFGGSKVRTLFNDSQDALAGSEAPEKPAVVVAANPVPALDAGAPPVDAGSAGLNELLKDRPAVYFPASKSMGGLALPRQQPTQQAQP